MNSRGGGTTACYCRNVENATWKELRKKEEDNHDRETPFSRSWWISMTVKRDIRGESTMVTLQWEG